MFHNISWPDFEIPKNCLIIFDIIHSLKFMNFDLTVVHCSDGVSRTGVFISLVQLINEIHKHPQTLNVFQTVLSLRKDRKFMVRLC